MKFQYLLSVFLLLSGALHAQKKVTLSGYVKEKKSQELLPGVTVSVPALKTGVATNAFGFYSLTLAEQDSITVVYSYLGLETVVKTFSFHKDRDESVEMDTKVEELKAAEVIADRKENVSKATQMSTISIPVQQIKEIPALLGEKDVFKVLQLLPGVQKGGEGNSGLYVRGGGPDQNLIILDDAPVYNAFHLFGFFSLFNGDALKSVELIKGGFPAQYGGRLSSVIDMRLKEGNKEKFHGEGGIGLISSRIVLEGPLGKNKKASFLVSGRRTYFDVFMRPFMKEEKTGYFFYDLNAKLNFELSPKDRLFLSGYFGKDKFYYKYVPDGTEQSKTSFGWGNATGTLRWNHLYSNKLFANTSLIFSDYKLDIRSEEKYNNNTFFLNYYSGIQDWGIKHDIDFFPHPDHRIKLGLASTFHTFKPGALVIKDGSSENLTGAKAIPSIESAIYVSDDFRIGARLRGTAGFRLSHYVHNSKQYFGPEPRLALAYSLTEDLSVKAAYSVMNQYMHLLSNTGIGLPTDLWVPATQNVAPQRSQQIAAGLAKDFFSKNFAITVEGFYKEMNNILGYKPGASFLDIGNNESVDGEKATWENKVTAGKGWAYGGEFLLQKKTGKFTGWVGYTLSWINHQFDEINFGEKFYPRYDRRHDLSVVGIYHLREEKEGKNGITMSATWIYGTGNAISLPLASYSAQLPISNQSFKDFVYAEDYGKYNSFRMAPYHRLDLGIQIIKKKAHYVRTLELSVYNAYNRKNPFFYYTERENGINKLKQVTLFPLIPSISWNYKF